MKPEIILLAFCGILIFNFLIGHILEWLNLSRMNSEIPGELKGLIAEEKYIKAQAYSKARSRLRFVTSTFSFAITLTALLTGFFGWLDNYLRQWTTDPFQLALLFFVVIYGLSEIAGIPVAVYNTFVIEQKFGFNKTTPLVFIFDKIKSWVVAFVVGGGLLYLLIWLITELGDNFWIWFWGAMMVVLLLIQFVYTSLFLPLFNKLDTLQEGELKTAIEEYCRQMNFPVSKVLIMNGSKRSTKTNAFFTGFGKSRKVVLLDTLLAQHPKEELVAILAHEVGHYRKHHILKGLLFSSLQFGLMMFIFSRIIFSPSLFGALGGTEPATHLSLLSFGILYSPISHLLSLFVNLFSRTNEFQADRFASETFGGDFLKSALVRLHEHNLTNLTPHPAYVFVNYSHPPLLHRLRALGTEGLVLSRKDPSDNLEPGLRI